MADSSGFEPVDVFVIAESSKIEDVKFFLDALSARNLTYALLPKELAQYHEEKKSNLQSSKLVVYVYQGATDLLDVTRECLRRAKELGKAIVVSTVEKKPIGTIVRALESVPIAVFSNDFMDWLKLRCSNFRNATAAAAAPCITNTNRGVPAEFRLWRDLSQSKHDREVVICYARKDDARVEVLDQYLVMQLGAEGITIWRDKRMNSQTLVSHEIARRIKKCWSQLIVWSVAASTSRWVPDEVHFGERESRNQVHIAIEECNPPPPYSGRNRHAITVGNPHPVPPATVALILDELRNGRT